MDGIEYFALILLYLVGVPILGIVALVRVRRLREEVALLRTQLATLQFGGMAERSAPRPADPAPGDAEPADDGDEISEEAESRPPPEPEWTTAAPGRLPESGAPRDEPESPEAPAAAARATTTGATVAGLEQSLTSRWLVWLGGITLALGGVFLVRYSIEQGWLGPTVRILLGLLFGAALILGGEALRRRPLQQAIAAVGPNYVPPALTAAGLSIAYVSVYAAFALYDLVLPLTAFVCLAALAALAIGLSLLQGPFIALLGLVGGYAVPALVGSEAPSAWALFGYLLALTAPSLTLVRVKGWAWLGLVALVGAALWPAFWMLGFSIPDDVLPLGLYLVLGAGLFLGLKPLAAPEAPALGESDWPSGIDAPELLAWLASLAFAVLGFALVRAAEGESLASIAALLLTAVLMAAAWRERAVDGLLVLAALFALLLIASWQVPANLEQMAALYRIEGREYGRAPGPWVPLSLADLALFAALFAALIGFGAQLLLGSAARPPLWAAVSAVTPVAILGIAYWRIAHLGLDLKWAGLALGLAALNLLAAARVARMALLANRDAALGFAALGVTAAISLGAAMALQQAWLTVVLSLQLPVLGALYRRFRVPSLMPVAAALALLVLIRLVFNPYVLDYPAEGMAGLSWVIYGYGIPALAFWLAARWFARPPGARGDERLIALLDGGCLVFVFLLATLEIRILLSGDLRVASNRLLEASLQSLAWLAMALTVYWQARRDPRPVLIWAWRVLLGLAAAQVLLVQALVESPLVTGQPVGDWPLANLLSLAYLLPGLFALLFAWLLGAAAQRQVAMASGIAGLLLLFLSLSLEVRRAFQGSVLSGPAPAEGELYAYSVAWLLFAGVLLALGIARALPVLRYASLALLLLTAAKVFLLDLSDLTGLWRVASFIGLGLTLVGIGYLYQRFVFPPRPAAGQGG